jgi:hypothetical protein
MRIHRLFALLPLFLAGCGGGIDVTATYRGETFEPTNGVAIDSTPPFESSTKQMVIAMSTAPISCSFNLDDKEDLPAGKYLFLNPFSQEAGQALQAFIAVAFSEGPDSHQDDAFITDVVDISSVDGGRVTGSVSVTRDLTDPTDDVMNTLSAEGSFDVERCF